MKNNGLPVKVFVVLELFLIQLMLWTPGLWTINLDAFSSQAMIFSIAAGVVLSFFAFFSSIRRVFSFRTHLAAMSTLGAAFLIFVVFLPARAVYGKIILGLFGSILLVLASVVERPRRPGFKVIGGELQNEIPDDQIRKAA